MGERNGIGLSDVRAVYSGPEGDLWELIMGQQVHIGGMKSSMDLADTAEVGPGMRGIDLCCCNGAGMRFLVRMKNVDRMTGVDATAKVVQRGQDRCHAEGLADRIEFKLADVCASGLPDAQADFVWGEDAWCYVEDKEKLISEAVRLTKPGGLIAFTDWIEAEPGLTEDESRRLLAFMKFPNVQTLHGYSRLLSDHGCKVLRAQNTHRFAPCVDLYLQMLDVQLTYDALRIIGFDMTMMQALAGEMVFMQGLARAGKIAQGLFVARKQ